MLYYLLVKNLQHISIRFEKKSQKKSVNGLGFFSVNGLGLNFCGIFEEKANYRSDFGKKRREKSSELSVKFENLEKMSKWTRLFQ